MDEVFEVDVAAVASVELLEQTLPPQSLPMKYWQREEAQERISVHRVSARPAGQVSEQLAEEAEFMRGNWL